MREQTRPRCGLLPRISALAMCLALAMAAGSEVLADQDQAQDGPGTGPLDLRMLFPGQSGESSVTVVADEPALLPEAGGSDPAPSDDPSGPSESSEADGAPASIEPARPADILNGTSADLPGVGFHGMW